VLATERLYWADDDCLITTATCVAVHDGALAFDRSCFYAGGGGQPCDEGEVESALGTLRVTAVQADPGGVLWHTAEGSQPTWLGLPVTLRVDPARRAALSRYHTVLHVLNTIAQRDYGAWITGAQIATTYARIDFQWDGFAPALRPEIEAKVNAVLASDRPLRATWLSEAEFAARPELLRTLEVKPPVIEGRVRVVEIAAFDTQACGGTHVHSTAELGRFSITKTENKGKINKRLYVHLLASEG
jgi:misacylated tRNA(Ala) deacylase